MDTHDVSNVDQYTRSLEAQKKILKEAKKREGEIPRDRKTRDEIVEQQELSAVKNMLLHLHMEHQDRTQINSSFLPPPYPPSIAPLDRLAQIYIDELQLGIHHRGKFLLARVASSPSRMTAIMTAVEDERDAAVLLQLYHQPDEHLRPSSSIVSRGDVVVVKEPFFKVMGDGEYGVRVDHVSDLMYIDESHKLYPQKWKKIKSESDSNKSADTWKQEGNVAMGKKQYWEAIRWYTRGLGANPSASEEKVIRLNRSLAYLQNGNFEAALADASCLMLDPATSEKALYRASKALYALQRFSECQKMLETLYEKYPKNFDAKKELERVSIRVAEQKYGTYDFEAMYKEATTLRPPKLDHATFVGPIVVKNSPGRGQGLFTTKAVKAGELLLGEKAFAHCYAPNPAKYQNWGSKLNILVNVQTSQMTLGTHGDLITSIVQKLWHNPSLVHEFLTLYCGSYKSVELTEIDGRPVIDTFLIERIIMMNSFGCPLSSKDFHQDPTQKNDSRHFSTGMWLRASKINHSCINNVERTFIADMQIIRAICDIPANTELLFWYTGPTGDHGDMQSKLSNWGFECKCAMCIDSQNTSEKMLGKRKALLQDLESTFNNPTFKIDTSKADQILTDLGKTYLRPASEIPRVRLRAPYVHLASVCSQQGSAEKALSAAVKALEALGFVIKGTQLPLSFADPFRVEKWGLMMDDVVGLFVLISNAFAAMAPELVPHIDGYAKTAYRICIGEDVTFKETYGQHQVVR